MNDYEAGRVHRFSPSMKRDFNYLRHLGVKNWHKLQIYFMFPQDSELCRRFMLRNYNYRLPFVQLGWLSMNQDNCKRLWELRQEWWVVNLIKIRDCKMCWIKLRLLIGFLHATQSRHLANIILTWASMVPCIRYEKLPHNQTILNISVIWMPFEQTLISNTFVAMK